MIRTFEAFAMDFQTMDDNTLSKNATPTRIYVRIPHVDFRAFRLN